MRSITKAVLSGFLVIGLAFVATTHTDLGSPEVWKAVERPFGAVYPVLLVTRVIDGDTFEAWIHIAPRLAYFADVRLDGVDTPEMTGNCKEQGQHAQAQVEQILLAATEITVEVTAVDSFGRWVCHVAVDAEDLATWIRQNRLTKADLCQQSSP